jgi:uncharacterized protein (DUF2062 family)
VALLNRVRILFTIKDSPERLAMSFSTGLFIGISPLLGLHTILSIMVASVFRLNKLVTLMGTYVTNPWSLVPIYAFCTWVGTKLTGTTGVSGLNFHEITVFNILKTLKGLFWPFVVGTTTVAIVSAFLSYWIVLFLVKRFREGERG